MSDTIHHKGAIWRAAAAVFFLAALWFGYDRYYGQRPDPKTVVEVSLQGLKEQEKLLPFTARYVAVVTTSDQKLGLTAQKTLILPGTVRYELDLGLLTAPMLNWDEQARTLDITLPPLALSGPEFELEAAEEYGEGRILLELTDIESKLDAANIKAAKAQLLAQAKASLPMKLAREAAVNAVENAFAMPLEAVGIQAKVTAHFEEDK